jgi:N6-adenosine-specific RNA methylase IME4
MSGAGVGVRYRTIVADPPWPYDRPLRACTGRTAGRWTGPIVDKPLPYPSMSVEEIGALPLNALAADDCRLFCWTTNQHLPLVFPILETWGFTYRQTLVWHKRSGNLGGTVAPSSCEFLLVATTGKPELLSRMRSSFITTGKAVGHSSKPDAFLDLIEEISPGPYLELFARRQRLGWDTWGNEALNHVELAG